jgi:hypothetical protein
LEEFSRRNRVFEKLLRKMVLRVKWVLGQKGFLMGGKVFWGRKGFFGRNVFGGRGRFSLCEKYYVGMGIFEKRVLLRKLFLNRKGFPNGCKRFLMGGKGIFGRRGFLKGVEVFDGWKGFLVEENSIFEEKHFSRWSLWGKRVLWKKAILRKIIINTKMVERAREGSGGHEKSREGARRGSGVIRKG